MKSLEEPIIQWENKPDCLIELHDPTVITVFARRHRCPCVADTRDGLRASGVEFLTQNAASP